MDRKIKKISIQEGYEQITHKNRNTNTRISTSLEINEMKKKILTWHFFKPIKSRFFFINKNA